MLLSPRLYKIKWLAYAVLLYSGCALAKLPSVGTLAGAGSGWLENVQAFFKGSADVIALFVVLLLFLTVSYTLLSKFNDWRQGRAELADVTVLAIVAAVVLIIVSIMLGIATKVL